LARWHILKDFAHLRLGKPLVSFLVSYLTMLSVATHRASNSKMTEEFDRIWKELVMA
jgi:hypothetical protein